MLVVACGDGPTEPPPNPVEYVNVEGEFSAPSIGGEVLPMRAGTFQCEGEEVDLYILRERIGLYDNNPDPEELESVYRARRTGAEDGSCWTEVLAWGTYRATSDSVLFSWDGAEPISGGAWVEENDVFDAEVPEGSASFQRVAPEPVAPAH